MVVDDIDVHVHVGIEVEVQVDADIVVDIDVNVDIGLMLRSWWMLVLPECLCVQRNPPPGENAAVYYYKSGTCYPCSPMPSYL